MLKRLIILNVKSSGGNFYRYFAIYGELGVWEVELHAVHKYWDMPEEQFFEERKTERSPFSKYRDFFIEELKKNPNEVARILYDKILEEFGYVGVSVSSRSSLSRYLKTLRRKMGLTELVEQPSTVLLFFVPILLSEPLALASGALVCVANLMSNARCLFSNYTLE